MCNDPDSKTDGLGPHPNMALDLEKKFHSRSPVQKYGLTFLIKKIRINNNRYAWAESFMFIFAQIM